MEPTEHSSRQGNMTGKTISWFNHSLRRSNSNCIYCGHAFTEADQPPSDKEHLIARRFVPTGTMDGQFNFIFRACRTCNARKADAERHVSSVTLFNSPGRLTDSHADAEAKRKAENDFHPHMQGVLVKDASQHLDINGKHLGASVSVKLTGPPQIDRNAVYEVALGQVQGLFSLITSEDYTESSKTRLLPEDQFDFFDIYPSQDWGNPHIVEISNRVKDWECVANIDSAKGYFRATLRCSESGWFWALEWNKQLRVLGGIGKSRLQVFENLPDAGWKATVQGRMRREAPLDPTIDILFLGKVDR